ncbi:hypothetical protein [Leifsonia sp. P73]
MIPNRYRLPLSASLEELERDGFERLIDVVNTAPEEERVPRPTTEAEAAA